MYTAKDHDSPIDFYIMQVHEDDLWVGPSTNTDAIVLAGDNMTLAGDLTTVGDLRVDGGTSV